jgi:hypothetical protein
LAEIKTGGLEEEQAHANAFISANERIGVRLFL